uniref:Uncharacterized protein n=1 Tax=Triticum urartu TaxID=4572 RepID=A0A8R7THJ3_TRIUA
WDTRDAPRAPSAAKLRRLRRPPRAVGWRRWTLSHGGLHRLPRASRDHPHPLREAPSSREDFVAWLADNFMTRPASASSRATSSTVPPCSPPGAAATASSTSPRPAPSTASWTPK